MRTLAAAAFVLIAASMPSLATDPPKPSCSFPHGQCGYVDAKGKAALFDPSFDWVEPFSSGLARVRKGGLYGVATVDGRLEVGARWDYLGPLRDGFRISMQARRFGILKGAAEILPPKFARIIALAPARFLIDTSVAGHASVFEVERSEETVPEDPFQGKFGLGDGEGRWIVRPKWQEIRLFGRGATSFWARPTSKWQLVDSDGAALTEPVYDTIEPAGNGYAIARIGNRTIVLDAQATLAVPVEASFVRLRPDGIITFQVEGRIGAVGLDGTLRLPPRFESIGTPSNGRVTVMLDGTDTVVDYAGRPISGADPPSTFAVTPTRSTASGSGCTDGEHPLKSKGKWGLVDRRGRPILAPAYDAVSCFERGAAWVAIAAERAWCRVAKDGTRLSEDCRCRVQLRGTEVEQAEGEPSNAACYVASVAAARRALERRRR